MLRLAREDLEAAAIISDAPAVRARIFGFHAQQAVEKSLKAWLCLVGVEYPRIHDLGVLAGMLVEHGEPLPERFRGLEFLTDFAVQFRYAAFEDLEDGLDRRSLIREVTDLVKYVERLLSDAEGRN